MSVRCVEAVVRPRRYLHAPRAHRFSIALWQQEISAECSRYPRSPILFQVNQPRVLLPRSPPTSARVSRSTRRNRRPPTSRAENPRRNLRKREESPSHDFLSPRALSRARAIQARLLRLPKLLQFARAKCKGKS